MLEIQHYTKLIEGGSNMSGKNELQVWNSILEVSLKIPGARIDRTSFLRSSLTKYCESGQVELAINENPKAAGVSMVILDKISKGCINLHTAQVSALSFAAGLPGGLWLAGTIPADLSQFYFNVIQIVQKLAYLYGWPELFAEDEEKLDDETLLKFTLFIGVMFGSREATMAVTEISKRLAQQVVKRLPQKALAKYGLYNLVKQIGKWIGVKITKESFARGLGKVVPIMGGFISGTVSFLSFKSMCNNFKKHLKNLPLAN